MNYLIVGLEADAVRRAGKKREQMEKGSFFNQWLSRRLYTFFYFTGSLAAYFGRNLPKRKYEIEIDGKNADGFYWGVSFFNGSFYSENLHPLKLTMPYDGNLDMIFIRDKGLLTYLLYPFYMTGNYKLFPNIFSWKQGRKINIRSDEPLIVSMDDEIFYMSELSVELLPSAVKFVDASEQGYIGGRQ